MGTWSPTQVLCRVEENLIAAPSLQSYKLSFKWVLRAAVLGLSTSCWYESEPSMRNTLIVTFCVWGCRDLAECGTSITLGSSAVEEAVRVFLEHSPCVALYC